MKKKVSQLELKMGKFTMTNDFYVVELVDTNVLLGVRWLHSIGKHLKNYQIMEMEFTVENGKRVVLRDMSNDAPKIVRYKKMEIIFRNGDVSLEANFFITTHKPSDNNQNYHVYILSLLRKHDQDFEEIPLERPPKRGF